jgi:hypothetical protein
MWKKQNNLTSDLFNCLYLSPIEFIHLLFLTMGVDDKYRRKIHSKFGFCYCKFLKAIEERLNHDVGKQASLIKAIDRWSSNKI